MPRQPGEMREGRRLRIVLLEAGLELVPEEIRGHPDVARSAKRYGVDASRMLLDKSLHYHAMSVLPQKWKRGRPDIVHTTLLVLQDSVLNSEGRLEVYIHVYDGRVFRVKPETRLPKHYERFRGLMAQLLLYNRVPPSGEQPLIELEAASLREFVERHGRLILLWERGEPSTSREVAAKALQSGRPVGIGMFPRGDFRRSTLRKAGERYSLAQGKPLKAWTIACKLVTAAEDILGLTW